MTTINEIRAAVDFRLFPRLHDGFLKITFEDSIIQFNPNSRYLKPKA